MSGQASASALIVYLSRCSLLLAKSQPRRNSCTTLYRLGTVSNPICLGPEVLHFETPSKKGLKGGCRLIIELVVFIHAGWRRNRPASHRPSAASSHGQDRSARGGDP